jgi:hypothetical protein
MMKENTKSLTFLTFIVLLAAKFTFTGCWQYEKPTPVPTPTPVQ